MKVGDLLERRYETGQYGPNAIGLVIDIAECRTLAKGLFNVLFQYADDGTTDWVSVEDLKIL